MSNENAIDSGPAFPHAVVMGDRSVTQGGMSLRDWFAAQALASWTSLLQSGGLEAIEKAALAEGYFGTIDGYAAFRAYRAADAMLAERSKDRGGP